MITKIEYQNDNDEIITEQQAEMSASYYKCIYEDNELKKIEKHSVFRRYDSTKAITGGIYYLSDTEDYQTIVDQYTNLGKSKTWWFYFNKQTNAFGYYSWEMHRYSRSDLELKRVEGYNNQNKIIVDYDLDYLDGDKIIGKKKYLSTPAIRNLFYGGLVIYYNDETNEIQQVLSREYSYYSLADFLNSGITAIYDWYGNPYYHNFYPILPEGPLSE